jgi:hypothetical protein
MLLSGCASGDYKTDKKLIYSRSYVNDGYSGIDIFSQMERDSRPDVSVDLFKVGKWVFGCDDGKGDYDRKDNRE